MALCTKEDVKDFLKKTSTEDDELIEQILIPAAQGFIEGYCRRTFEINATPAEVIEYHNGGADRIFLKQFPADPTYALKLYEDFSRVFASDTLVEDEDYYVDYDSGIVFCDYELARGWGAVKVVYKPVASTGDFPEGENAVARQICIELVARKMKMGPAGDIGVMSRTTGGGASVTYDMSDILPETKAMLDSISRPL